VFINYFPKHVYPIQTWDAADLAYFSWFWLWVWLVAGHTTSKHASCILFIRDSNTLQGKKTAIIWTIRFKEQTAECGWVVNPIHSSLRDNIDRAFVALQIDSKPSTRNYSTLSPLKSSLFLHVASFTTEVLGGVSITIFEMRKMLILMMFMLAMVLSTATPKLGRTRKMSRLC
jgi:hypothetical protein